MVVRDHTLRYAVVVPSVGARYVLADRWFDRVYWSTAERGLSLTEADAAAARYGVRYINGEAFPPVIEPVDWYLGAGPSVVNFQPQFPVASSYLGPHRATEVLV